MLREGPIPAAVHGAWEYVAGCGLIAAPLLIDYSHGSATAVSVVLGVIVLILTSTTVSRTSLVNQIPVTVHVVVDYAVAAIMIGAPFLFGFSGEGAPTAVFLVGGVVHLLLTIGTRFEGGDRPSEPRRALRDEEIPEFEPPSRSG
jgi:hypothetical protein